MINELKRAFWAFLEYLTKRRKGTYFLHGLGVQEDQGWIRFIHYFEIEYLDRVPGKDDIRRMCYDHHSLYIGALVVQERF